MNQFSNNLSDLAYQPAAAGGGDVLWGIQNDPSTLYCLLWNGTTWSAMTEDGWTYGKALQYPTGLGSPDAEGITRAEASSTAVYVAAERDNLAGSISRLSVLRYDFAGTAAALVATNEWNLTAALPASPANNGIEGITWIPDSFLVGNRFFDEAAGAVYDPGRYPDHGTGLFFVGHEAGGIYGFALDQSAGTFTRVATIASGQAAVMSLYFDRDVGNLWTYCDNSCAQPRLGVADVERPLHPPVPLQPPDHAPQFEHGGDRDRARERVRRPAERASSGATTTTTAVTRSIAARSPAARSLERPAAPARSAGVRLPEKTIVAHRAYGAERLETPRLPSEATAGVIRCSWASSSSLWPSASASHGCSWCPRGRSATSRCTSNRRAISPSIARWTRSSSTCPAMSGWSRWCTRWAAACSRSR